ncbi:hypothetical protein GQ457_01G004600 [Hibiscus cannabinus]
MGSPPLSNNNELPNASFDLYDFQTSIFLYLLGLVLVVLFVQIIERVHNLLRNEIVVHLDIESDQLAEYHSSMTDDFDGSMSQNNVWVWEIFNGFMAHLAERRYMGLRSEFLEQVSPCVSYKSLEETTLDECVICLESFEQDEMCRIFPACNHVFHSECLDRWMKRSIVTILVLFIDVFERVYNWLRIEAIDRLDIESGQLAPSSADNVDWSHEPMTHNILRVLEIFNRFMAYFSERQDPGLRPEFLEQVSPCVSYKNMGETTLDECVICLEGFEDDEMCRDFRAKKQTLMKMIALSFAIHSLNLPLIISSLAALGIAVFFIVLLCWSLHHCYINRFLFVYIVCSNDAGSIAPGNTTYCAIIISYLQILKTNNRRFPGEN